MDYTKSVGDRDPRYDDSGDPIVDPTDSRLDDTDRTLAENEERGTGAGGGALGGGPVGGVVTGAVGGPPSAALGAAVGSGAGAAAGDRTEEEVEENDGTTHR